MSEFAGMSAAAPVLVTGATGYVASWIVNDLLRDGYTVHAAVRDPENTAKVAHLQKLAEQHPGTLRLFQADLLAPGSYREAMAGCEVVMHTASPFTSKISDPQKDLVDPALEGTRNVLASVNETPSVRRVVLTSSIAAMFTEAAELPDGLLTPDRWNGSATLDYQPYYLSKRLAEQEAWRIAGEQERWDLVTIHPSLVIGPALSAHPTSESFGIVKELGSGKLRFGAPQLALSLVDVRDVAAAHLAAAQRPQAHGRYIVSGSDSDLLGIGLALQAKYGDDYPLPRGPLPAWLFNLLAPLAGVERRFARGNVGKRLVCDTSRSREELGLTYRSTARALEEMFPQALDFN
ncbi:NAD-dependent epimerase/dehydratase family protein [Dermabacteraceae bacterium TAE3-ERU27]|nr:NAD-dependent epimerase/dehydratase family protein [Dermabacteraceae bacterium TAE3-ERU27]